MKLFVHYYYFFFSLTQPNAPSLRSRVFISCVQSADPLNMANKI